MSKTIWSSDRTLNALKTPGPCDRTVTVRTSLSHTSHSIRDDATSSTASSHLMSLNFANVNVVGRSDELRVLQDAFNRICQPQAASEIVIVRGESGTGKSTLCACLETNVQEANRGFFVSGKFGQLEDHRPYGALVDSATELCHLIHASDDKLELVRKHLDTLVGAQVQALIKVVPAIAFITDDSNDDTELLPSDFAFQRFVRLFRLFLNATTASHPLVLFLDDLQWADEASRQLLVALAKDARSKNLLLIFTVRSEEKYISELLPLQEQAQLFISTVTVGPLSEESVNEIVAKVTDLRVEDTKELSAVVFRKTGGNAYFVIQYLEMLHRERQLTYNFNSNHWEWNIESISRSTNVSDNVGQLLTYKIQGMPHQVQVVLRVAACLGFTFDERVLCVVMSSEDLSQVSLANTSIADDAHDKNVHDQGALHKIVEEAVEAGLIEQRSEGRYKFSHDRVQQAAASIEVHGDQLERQRFRIGEVILGMSRSEGADAWMLFAAVDLLTKNALADIDDTRKEELSRLCLDASEKAYQKSAFASSAHYADKGLTFLCLDRAWKEHYDLCLELFTRSAEMHFSSGHVEESRASVSTILHHAGSLDDKLRACFVHVSILGALGALEEGTNEAIAMLKQMGVDVPRNPGKRQVVFSARKVSRVLKGRKPTDLLGLPPMTDSKLVAAMRLLGVLIVFDWRGGQLYRLVMHSLVMMQLTLQHGICSYGAISISLYAVYVGSLNKFDEAYELGCVAEQLLSRPGSNEGKAFGLKIIHYYQNHLKQPIFKSLEPSLQAFQMAQEEGDICMAAYCLQQHGMLSVFIGMPLESLEKELEGYCEYCREFRQDECLNELLPFYQLSLNLMGESENPLVLTGRGMDEKVFATNMNCSTEGAMPFLLLLYAKRLLLYVFDELELADVERRKITPQTDFPSTMVLKHMNWFLGGMICLGLARKTKGWRHRNKHKREAQWYIKELKKVAKAGSVNCAHFVKLLDAEQQALIDRSGGFLKEYDTAISMGSRCGFRLFKAICLQRAGDYLLECGDSLRACDYLQRSYCEYNEYGAKGKLSELEQKYESVICFEKSSVFQRRRSSEALRPFLVKVEKR